MLPKEYSEDKEAWRRKWRARRKQNEAQEGQGTAAESGGFESGEDEARDGEAESSGN